MSARVSTADGAWHAFLWDVHRGMQDLGTLGGATSGARGINAQGQVVGGSSTADQATHAFLWDADTGMQDLHTFGEGVFRSSASAINDRGQVVGSNALFSVQWGFLWDAETGMQDLGVRVFPNAIDARGRVVGARQYALTPGSGRQPLYVAFLWDPRLGLQDLDSFPVDGRDTSEATDINARGQVVGWSVVGFNVLGRLWDARGNEQVLNFFAHGINARGQVVGTASGSSYVWAEHTGLLELADLGGSSSAEDINARGQVVGWSETADGVTRAVLWEPDSE